MSYVGEVKNGVVVLARGTQLPEGIRVWVEPVPEGLEPTALLETRVTFFGSPSPRTTEQTATNLERFRAMRHDPRYEPMWPFLDLVLSGQQSTLDVDAIIANRAIS